MNPNRWAGYLLLAFLASPAWPVGPVRQTSIATFNVEWLADRPGEGAVRRSPEDYRHVAQAITLTEAALLCLQEVENDGALERIEALLPVRFRHRMLDTPDRQDQAILFDPRVVTVAEGPIALNPELLAGYHDRLHIFHRSPVRYYLKMNGFDFYLVQVHFKAGGVGHPRSKDAKKRLEECRRLGLWVRAFLARSADKDLLIAGDCNDTLGSPALEALARESGCRPLTAEIRRQYSHRPTRVLLDHLFASPDVIEYEQRSVRAVHLETVFTPAALEKISDHDPVAASFIIR
jgi:endonuclease/exonuclease/phosphatase family metal-dependent hydrolase